MAWELNSDRPIYAQILEKLQVRIVCGVYPPGEWLPSVRDLAAEASVNPNTMQKALAELERGGLVYSKRTSGRFITEDVQMIAALKSSLARDKIEAFLESMQNLGFQKEDTIALMQEMQNEREKENL